MRTLALRQLQARLQGVDDEIASFEESGTDSGSAPGVEALPALASILRKRVHAALRCAHQLRELRAN